MRRPTYSEVTSTLALIAATSGTAYAFSLPNNSVTSKKVKDHTLLARDFKKGQLKRGARGLTGPAGPQGAAGAAGAKGDKGDAGPSTPQTIADGSIGTAQLADSAVTNAKIAATAITAGKLGLSLVADSTAFDATANKSKSAFCPNGTTFMGGGAAVVDNIGSPLQGTAAISFSGPGLLLNGWHAEAYRTVASSYALDVWTFCMRQ